MAYYHERSGLLKMISAMDSGGVKEGDLLVEVGTAAFTTTATTVAVVTKLNKIVAGFAVPMDSYSPATSTNNAPAYQVFVRPDVSEDTNSMLKQWVAYRSSGAAISGLSFVYLLFGRIYDTA